MKAGPTTANVMLFLYHQGHNYTRHYVTIAMSFGNTVLVSTNCDAAATVQ